MSSVECMRMLSVDEFVIMAADFRINEEYAKNYNKFREKEELQKLKDKYGDAAEEEMSSSSDDEFSHAFSPDLDNDWKKTLLAIRTKDPKIYDKNFHFFIEKEGDKKVKSKSKQKKAKPYTLKDMEREAVLKKLEKFDENNEVESTSEENSGGEEEVTKKPGYYEEQEEIKQSFKSHLSDSDDDSSELFTVKEKTQEEEEDEETAFEQWQNQQQMAQASDDGQQNLPTEAVHGSDQLAMRFITNKNYEDEEEDLSDMVEKEGTKTEKELEAEFRLLSSEHHIIKRHPRTNAESMRRKDDKRARKRQELKEKKARDKQKKAEELKRLKNLKRKEIMEKIEQLKRITGNEDLGFTPEDIEGDFDAQKYDEMMQRVFDQDYYGNEEDGQKPIFDDDLDLDLQDENYDEWVPSGNARCQMDFAGEELGNVAHCEDPNFNMDADYDPDQPQQEEFPALSKKKRKKKKSKLFKALEKTKPVFEPEDKTFEEYFDEYYKLDYEDMIGDLPCRFKYRGVIANDYGLSAGEVLKADDKELNKWVSLKRITSIRPKEQELMDKKQYLKRARKIKTKYNVLPSLREESAETAQSKKKRGKDSGDSQVSEKEEEKMGQENSPAQNQKKKKKNQNVDLKHLQKRSMATDASKPLEEGSVKSDASGNENSKRKRKRRPKADSTSEGNTQNDVKKRKVSDAVPEKEKKKRKLKKNLKLISDSRLLAYGFNPKKVKYSVNNPMKEAKKDS